MPDLPPLDAAAQAQLRQAFEALTHPGLAARLAHQAGRPLDAGLARLPRRWQAAAGRATHRAVEAALGLALHTLPGHADPLATAPPAARNGWHRAAVMATGAGAGFIGLPALLVELPLTTTLMLRSIADIARAEGADLADPGVRLEAVGVLMLGGPATGDDGAGVGYWASREALAGAVAQALQHVGSGALGHGSPPALLRLLGLVAERFGVQVSEKFAAQALPVLGALGGATLNALFIAHFQAMAGGHFTLRRLERRHGAAEVRRAWDALAARA